MASPNSIAGASSSGGRSTLHRGLVSLTTSKDVLGTPAWEQTIKGWSLISDVGRTGLLQGGNVCGLSVFTKKPTSNTLSLSHGALTHLVVGATERIMGNLSTNPSKDQPAFVDAKAIKLYVTIMPASSAVGLPFPQGPPFQGNKFANLKAALNLDGRSTYVIVAAPVSFPTPWGIPSVARGDLDFEIENLFEIMHDPVGKAYLRVAEQHTVSKGEAVLAHASELASVLPDGILSLSPVADPFCSFVPLTPEEQENAYGSECHEHSLRLQAHLQPPVAPVPVVVTNNHRGGGDGASTVGGGLDMSVADNSLAPSPVQPSVKMNTRRTAFASLLNGRARRDPASGQVQFVPADLQPDCLAALLQTDTSIASSAFLSCIKETTVEYNGCRDYLCHPARLEAMLDPVVLGWALHAEGSPTNYDSMEEFVGQNEGLSILHFLPDSKAVASKRRKANAASAARKNQQYQGEDAKNLNKLSTTAVVMDHIGNLRQINIVLSNCSLLAYTFAKFDRSKNEPDAPLLHKMAYEVSELLNDRVFVTWYEDLDDKRRIPFLYWLVHELNSILQKLLDLAKVERYVQNFILKNFASITTSPWTAVEDSISAVCNKIHGLASGTSTEIPETKIFRTSSIYNKWEEQKLNAQSREIKLKLEKELRQQFQSQQSSTKRPGGPLVTPGGDDKRLRGKPLLDPDTIPAPSTPRTLGEIVWDRSRGNMPNPTPHKRDWGPPLCLSHIESSNTGCRLGNFCKYHHPPAFINWNPHMVSAWKDLVSKTDGMSWNSQLAPNITTSALVANSAAAAPNQSRPSISSSRSSSHSTAPSAFQRATASVANAYRQRRSSEAAPPPPIISQSKRKSSSTLASRVQSSGSQLVRHRDIQHPAYPLQASAEAVSSSSRPPVSSSSRVAKYHQRHFGIDSSLPSNLTSKSPSHKPQPFSSLFYSLQSVSDGSALPAWRLSDLPTHATLLRTPFGLPSLNHSFLVEPSFDTVAFNILKSGFLAPTDFACLCQVHPLIHHLATMIVQLSTVDFRHLCDPDPHWASCKAIPKFKDLEFLALLFHYDMHLSAAVRFLGSKYLGGHRDVDKICQQLSPHVDAETIAHYRRIMSTGCPNRFNASTSRENAELYRRHGNDPSISRHKELVKKNMVKEFKHNFAFPLPSWSQRYLRHSFCTPQHIHLHPSKPPRQIFNAKLRPTAQAQAINNMTSTPLGSELDCQYGGVLMRVLKRIWNLRISYPLLDIVLHANDVKSCFRQIQHHPDIVGAFSFVVFEHLWIQIGCTFGSDFSPANWEGVRRTIEQLARGLFKDHSLRDKHRKYLDKLQWDISLDSGKRKKFVPAHADSQNQGVLDANSQPADTPHDMFVDDDIYAEVYLRWRVEQAIAASIEAMFITLGQSDLLHRQDPISWDKLIEMVISHFNKVLGVEIDTRQMTVGPPPAFISRTLDLLHAFHEGRKAFTVHEMSTLVGNLGHIASTSRWLTHLLSHLYTSIASALHNNRAYEIETSAAFRDALRKASASELFTLDERKFHAGVVNRIVYKSQRTYFLNQTAKEELHLIREALSSSEISFRTPIAHLVPRDPTGTAWGDSSLDAAGGFSSDCKFWWYLEWSAEIKASTLRFHKNNSRGNLISINVLEYASVIINYAAMSFYFQHHHDPANPFPVALLYADNVAAEIWAIKGCKRSDKGRALGRLLCALMLNNPLGLSTARVSTHDNTIADEISRLKKEQDSLKFFCSLVDSYPQLRGCNRFHPSQELLSAITEALLTGKLVDPLRVNKIVLKNPGSITS